MAGGETVRVAKASWRPAEGEVTRAGQSRLVVRVRMRRIQFAPHPETEGAMCVRGARMPDVAPSRGATSVDGPRNLGQSPAEMLLGRGDSAAKSRLSTNS